LTNPESRQSPSQPTVDAPIVGTVQPSPGQIALDELMRSVQPLLKEWLVNQERMQERSLAYEEKAIKAGNENGKRILLVVSSLSFGMIGLAVLLVLRDRVDTALTLITLIVTTVSAAFGGFGVAQLRRGPGGEDE